MPSITINGASHSFTDGISILQAVRSAGLELPTMCFDDRLQPMGGCLC